jgi:hypothetical protein
MRRQPVRFTPSWSVLTLTLLFGFLVPACGGDAEEAAPAESTAVARNKAKPEAGRKGKKNKGKKAQTAQTATQPKAKPEGPVEVVASTVVDRGGTGEPAPEGLELPPPDPILGPVLVINGEVIGHDYIKREVVLGSSGRIDVELAKLETIMNQEIESRVAQGADREELLDTTGARPGVDGGFLGREELTTVFANVYLPEVAPDELPAISLEAFNASDQGKAMLQSLQARWDAMQEGETPENNPMVRSMLFQILTEYLVSVSDIDMSRDLPAHILMKVNGTEVEVDAIWERIQPWVSESQVRSAKQWLTKMKLLEQDMGEDWLSPEDAQAAYAAHSDPYKDSMFSMERLATLVKHYPSVDRYREFRHAYDSYQKKIRNELNPLRLKEFADQRTRQLLGQAQVDVDVILVSAYDFENEEWKDNGWDEAAKRAQEVLRVLVEEKKPWDDVVEEYSEFYDPPGMYEGNTNVPLKSKGRFRGQTRNQLMQSIQESECWQFLNGHTITDYIFFEQEPRTVTQPIRGPHGWYISRLLRRHKAPQMVNIEEESIITLAEQDYTLLHLAQYAQELVEKYDVYGLE